MLSLYQQLYQLITSLGWVEENIELILPITTNSGAVTMDSGAIYLSINMICKMYVNWKISMSRYGSPKYTI